MFELYIFSFQQVHTMLHGLPKQEAQLALTKYLNFVVENIKVKSCYNPLRLGTVIVLVSSGIDFVNTPRLFSDRATR